MVLVSALLYLMFAVAGAAALLSLVALSGYAVVWRGLDFPVSLRAAFGLLGVGAGLAAAAFALYHMARRMF
jgi:cytosine/uracil/thiamine/allantoin permease